MRFFDVSGSDGAVAIIEICEDISYGSISKTTLANAKGRFVGFGDGAIEGLFNYTMDNFVIRPYDEVSGVLSLDDGTIVVVEET